MEDDDVNSQGQTFTDASQKDAYRSILPPTSSDNPVFFFLLPFFIAPPRQTSCLSLSLERRMRRSDRACR